MRRRLVVAGVTLALAGLGVANASPGATTRVSISSGGNQGNNFSEYPSISADGRYVAFESGTSNLVPGDTNFAWDVFVRDRFPPFVGGSASFAAEGRRHLGVWALVVAGAAAAVVRRRHAA